MATPDTVSEPAESEPAESEPTGQSATQQEIAWEELADGRLHRLRRGADYTGAGDAVEGQAKAAAERLGKFAATYKDQLGKKEYLWVQFFDDRLKKGQACSNCGHRELEKVQEYFARCPNCDSLHALSDKPALGADLGLDADSDVAEILGLRVLDDEGEEVEEVSLLDEIALQMSCRFSRALPRVDAQFWIYRYGKRTLRVDSPAALPVAEAMIVRFGLRIGANVLLPGDYAVLASTRFLLGEDDEQSVKMTMPESQARKFQVLDPHSGTTDPHGATRTDLHWTVATEPLAASDLEAEEV